MKNILERLIGRFNTGIQESVNLKVGQQKLPRLKQKEKKCREKIQNRTRAVRPY